jgi:hypothetical protein
MRDFRPAFAPGSAGLFLLEFNAHQDADGGKARKEDQNCQTASVADIPGPEQEISGDQIRERPEHVHWRRRQSFSGRVRKGGGESVARDAVHKMRHCIREENSGKETGDVVIPNHWLFPSLKVRCARRASVRRRLVMATKYSHVWRHFVTGISSLCVISHERRPASRMQPLYFQRRARSPLRPHVWHVSCNIHGMSIQTQHTLIIVLHGNDHVMTVEERGRVTLIRSSNPEHLWAPRAQGGTSSSLSLASCKQTHLVMRECMKFEARP